MVHEIRPAVDSVNIKSNRSLTWMLVLLIVLQLCVLAALLASRSTPSNSDIQADHTCGAGEGDTDMFPGSLLNLPCNRLPVHIGGRA